MKRQVAITGPTPEFVRWSIGQRCSMREETDIDSVDQTEKRLRAIRSAGVALHEDRVFRGIAVWETPESRESIPDGAFIHRTDGIPRGFRVSEVLEPFGGDVAVRQQCMNCAANVDRVDGLFAGCFGWLNTAKLPETFIPALDELALEAKVLDGTLLTQPAFTQPAWYGLWIDGPLQSTRLDQVMSLLKEASRKSDGHRNAELVRIISAMRHCLQADLPLSVEVIPPGFSDGLHWTVKAHCDRCKAAWKPDERRCPACGKPGQGHPPIRRKVLGLRPYIELGVLIGPENVPRFLAEFHSQYNSE